MKTCFQWSSWITINVSEKEEGLSYEKTSHHSAISYNVRRGIDSKKKTDLKYFRVLVKGLFRTVLVYPQEKENVINPAFCDRL